MEYSMYRFRERRSACFHLGSGRTGGMEVSVNTLELLESQSVAADV